MAKRNAKPAALTKNRSANEELLRATVLRSVYLEKWKNGAVGDVVGFLNDEVLPDVTNELVKRLDKLPTGSPLEVQRLKDVVVALRDTLGDSINNKTKQLIDSKLGDLTKSEANWQASALRKVTKGLDLEFKVPSGAIVEEIVSKRAPVGATIKQHLSGLTDKAANDIERTLNVGLALGEGTDELVRRVQGTEAANFNDGVYQNLRRNVAATVRTSANYVVNQAREETMRANSDVVDKVKLVATLDDRTSLICAARDGEVYPVNEGPRPPFHPNCRTMVVALTKSAKDLGLEDVLGEGDESKVTRESMNGEVPGDITYEEWLEDQPEEVQRAVLGKSRFELWSQDKLNLKELVNDRNQVVSIEELDRITGADAEGLIEEPLTDEQLRRKTKEAEEEARRREAEEAARRADEERRIKEAADKEAKLKAQQAWEELQKKEAEKAAIEALPPEEKKRREETQRYEEKQNKKFAPYVASPVDAETTRQTLYNPTFVTRPNGQQVEIQNDGVFYKPSEAESKAMLEANKDSKPVSELITKEEFDQIKEGAKQRVESFSDPRIPNFAWQAEKKDQVAHYETQELIKKIGEKLGARESTIRAVYVDASGLKIPLQERAEVIKRMMEVLEEYPPDVTDTVPAVHVRKPELGVGSANAWCYTGPVKVTDPTKPFASRIQEGLSEQKDVPKGAVMVNARKLSDSGVNGFDSVKQEGYRSNFYSNPTFQGTLHHEIGHAYSFRFDTDSQVTNFKGFATSGPGLKARKLMATPGNATSEYARSNEFELHAEQWARIMQLPPEFWTQMDIEYTAHSVAAMEAAGANSSMLQKRLKCFVNVPKRIRDILPNFDWR